MTESEVMDDTPINLKQENNTAVTSFTHILPDQSYSTLSTVASSSGERTITIPTIIGNTVEHKTIRIVPAVMSQDNLKPVRKK